MRIDRNTENAVRTAGYYDQLWIEAGTDLDYTSRSRADFLVSALRDLQLEPGARILDYGCGRGWLAPLLAPFGAVTGIDFSAEGIRLARERYGKHATFVLADPTAPRLGLPADTTYDVVVCTEVIEHVLEQTAFVERIAGLVRRGGFLLLTTPNGNVWTRFREDPRFAVQLQPTENWLTTRDLRRLLRAGGFRVLRHEGRPVFALRTGVTGLVLRRRIERAARALGLSRAYWRFILPSAVYQVVVARKET